MPTISVNRERFFEQLGTKFTDEEFDELCFQFGIELDEVTSERKEEEKEKGSNARVSGLSEEIIYKIEIPANRYDLLCLEGLARALRVFLEKNEEIASKTLPKYKVIVPEEISVLKVFPETAQIRPVVVAAILRNIRFTQASYESFIDLQDKLHNGIGRRRQIVSMGTHDLDTVKGPFSYEAVSPERISFIPLNQDALVDGLGMMTLYETDNKLKKFLHLIRESPVYPVIYDSTHTVMSVPPIINSDHSKISLNTRNVFIEITATDETKALVALNTITIEFSKYCDNPSEAVEAVKIIYPDGRTVITPDFSDRQEIVDVEYINRCIGIKLSGKEMVGYLKRMFVESEVIGDSGEQLRVFVPPHRSDIFHACDVMEDVAIAYGFNRIPQSIPKSSTIGAAFPLNKLTDLLRREVALVGFSEVLTLTLCSHKENFEYLKRVDPGNEAVVLSNPKTIEYEVVHTSLVPEMLKTISSNKKMPLPIKVFQIADVVLQDSTTDVGARNERRLSAVVCDLNSGFEVIHGLLDRVMQMVGIKMVSADSNDTMNGYSIKPSSIPMYFPGRQAEVIYQGKVIGSFGIVHPEVLEKFEVPNVASLLEINIEPFL